MNKVLRLLSVMLVAVTLGTILFGATGQAASNGLGVTPRRDFTVQPGKSVSDTLLINNLSLNQELQVDISVIDFSAANETGTPALQLGEKTSQTPWSLRPFITLPKSVKVAPGKSADVPVTIKIPTGQGAGSYYSAVQYSAVNPETKERVNIAAATASLLFVTVPGDAKESLHLKQFGTWQSNANGDGGGSFNAFFLGSTPKEFAYRLTNQGNIAEQPTGSMVIKNMFGNTVAEIQDVNPKKQLVLIGQTRRIQVCIKTSILESKDPNGQQTQQSTCDNPGLWPGRYTAEMALYYGINGNNSQEILAKTSFWYIPWWSVIAFGLVIAFIVLMVWLVRRAFNGRRSNYRR